MRWGASPRGILEGQVFSYLDKKNDNNYLGFCISKIQQSDFDQVQNILFLKSDFVGFFYTPPSLPLPPCLRGFEKKNVCWRDFEKKGHTAQIRSCAADRVPFRRVSTFFSRFSYTHLNGRTTYYFVVFARKIQIFSGKQTKKTRNSRFLNPKFNLYT